MKVLLSFAITLYIQFLVFVTTCTWLYAKSYSSDEYYFLIEPPKQAVSTLNTIKVKIHYKLEGIEEKRLRIRPFLENGEVNFSKNLPDKYPIQLPTVGWLKMPALDKEFELSVQPTLNKTYLWLEVQDTLTGKIYKTQKVPIWSSGNYINYLIRLNEGIMKRSLDDRIVEWNNSKDGYPP